MADSSYWLSRLVRCHMHKESSCWLQEDGTHISRRECRCNVDEPIACPIDAHRIPWINKHPDFESAELSAVEL